MSEFIRQGMVKTVTVREYEDEAKYLKVTIKAPTDLPIAGWVSSSSKTSRHVDEIQMAVPLDTILNPGDVVAIHVQINAPYAEGNRFLPALEVGDTESDVLNVMVEESMIGEGSGDMDGLT